MNLSVRDVSVMLGVSEKTVYRWINEQNLPGYRLSGQYRFNRAEILEWATANRINVSPAALGELETEAQSLPTLAEALQAGGIFYRISGRDKQSALAAVVEVLRLPDEVDREHLLQVLLAREQLASTGIGGGIAIPHVRSPIVLHVPKPTITLCFLETAVDFGALDGKPVRALFTLVSPTVRAHLNLLSRLAFALRDARFRALVDQEATREAILSEVEQLSQALVADSAGNAQRQGADTP
ncbi:MAG TPA: PTS sugar transporter subunit IIA [Verrucomicrobiota bacterium]|nr:PTS sugar transporter subunit IIA [Verrucomicrobiota bacterium]